MPDDNDFLDGCSIDFSEYEESDEISELRVLFPDGDPSTEKEWKELFNG